MVIEVDMHPNFRAQYEQRQFQKHFKTKRNRKIFEAKNDV